MNALQMIALKGVKDVRDVVRWGGLREQEEEGDSRG